MVIDIVSLQSTEFLIPFLFSLAIIYGLLEVIGIFRRNKAVNFIVAFCLSFFAMIYPGFVDFLWANFGLIAIFFIAMFFILFVSKIFGFGGRNSADVIIINGGILFILLSVSYLHRDSLPYVNFIGSGENLILPRSYLLLRCMHPLRMAILRF